MAFCIQIVTALKPWCRNVVDKIWPRNIQHPISIKRRFPDGIFLGGIDQDNICKDTEAAMTLRVVGEQQRRWRNKRWRACDQLPLRDTALLAFVVKASELSVSGMLALNGASAAALHMWIFRKQTLGDKSKSVCEDSGWKTCISLAPFAMYQLTAWVSSMAKAVEDERSCLGVISGFVLAFFVWPVFLGGLMTHCMAGAAIWKIFLVATTVILIMLAIWATTFNRPKILRRCFFCWCCFGRDPDVAAARAIQQDVVAQACNDRAFAAYAAYVAQVALEEKAGIAMDRASEARRVQAKAEQEAAVAKNREQEAWSYLNIARDIAQLVNDDAAAGSVPWLHETENAHEGAKKATADAEERARETAADAHNEMEKAREADEEAKSAATVAQAEYEKAAAAKAVLAL